MAVTNAFEEIRASRDQQLNGLAVALDWVQERLRNYLPADGYKNRLYLREIDLMAERNAVREQARDEVLKLPEVVAARRVLVGLGSDMKEQAAKMVHVTEALATSGKVLSIAQKFVDTVAEPQNADGK